MSVLPPLSLYIHVPWCVRKCPYCDFNSHESQGDIPEADYITALIEDLKQDLHWVQGREIQSIFFGGGTPSLLSARAYDTLFDGL
ncbi:MAG: radical SAM protein, partial [Pseudomonadota bacterium]|nr:radical SAM protein [Pseudomonadota bacterium]